MSRTISHFAINADDLPRARSFYEGVFGWRFEAWGPPGFFQIVTGDPGDAGALRGALQQRRELAPGKVMHGFECSVSVDDLGAVLAAVKERGGTLLMDPTVIAGVGTLAFFEDTEGNVVGAMQYDAAAD